MRLGVLLSWVLLLLVSGVGLGCGDSGGSGTSSGAGGCSAGATDHEAKIVCDEERSSKMVCVTASAYDRCVACQKSCGCRCQAQATCPETYACE